MPASPPTSRKKRQHGEACTDAGSSGVSDRARRDSGRAAATPRQLQSVVEIKGMQSRSACGYCKARNGSSYYVLQALRLSCENYQDTIDRGWRRSGDVLYMTDHSDSCCCFYPIRTRALDYVPGSSDKRVLRRWRRRFGAACVDNELADAVCATTQKQLRIVVESTDYSDEKYRVFEKYQRLIHNDRDATRLGFREFLCDSPLAHCRQDTSQDAEGLQRLLPRGFGSYHMCYYVDGALAAVGVIDALPRCVSAVYLFYDPDYSELSLGSFSALREMALVRQLHRYIPSISYYYPGYYVPRCSKMTYKARWRPAEMLDLVSYKWIPTERCLQRIADYPGFCTFDPDLDSRRIVRKEGETLEDAAPAFYSPRQ
ncbi:Arginyl-tRNA--protein transferase 1, partial [Coemansia sp. RSA 2599]